MLETKGLSKPTHMGSSFKELVARKPIVKTNLNSDTRIKSSAFLNYLKPQINARGLLAADLRIEDYLLSFLVVLEQFIQRMGAA